MVQRYIRQKCREIPGGPVTKDATFPVQGAQVQSLVRELDPTGHS